ncbi:MAG: alpha/beta hydrolase [Porticoccaceae bacterium]|nr:alpha/beta hydrolase [Porticoccaceae bacterium]
MDIDPDQLVDPELATVLSALPNFSDLSAQTLGDVRRLLAGDPIVEGKSGSLVVSKIHIPGKGDQPGVNGILYQHSESQGRRPAILSLHGGGFVAGTAQREDAVMRQMAADVGAVIVSVDYRLAPETPFPGALDDSYAALAWLHMNADALGVDKNRIAVRGVSAGGGLAAGLALLTRDRGEFPIAYQLLIYPMLDDRTQAHPCAGRHVWPIEANGFGWRSYLGADVVPGSAAVSPYAAAARAENLAGLPPTFIAVGSIDLFVDEDLHFARDLIRAGVPTELHLYPGAYHGFNLIESAAVTGAFQQDVSRALKKALKI